MPSLLRAPRALAAKDHLLIKGGRVIDASQKLNGIMDVAITAGRIAALQPDIASSDAADVIDVRGKIVTAGLVDLHAHLDSPDTPPAHCLSTGVTSIVDGGSRGADNVADWWAWPERAPTGCASC